MYNNWTGYDSLAEFFTIGIQILTALIIGYLWGKSKGEKGK